MCESTLSTCVNIRIPNIDAAHDDGDRESETWGISGCAILTVLNELDRADRLKPDSKFQDLSLVMAMALKWSADQEDYGYDEEHLEWRNSVVAYAKKAGIDLVATAPLHDAQELVDGVDEVEDLGNTKADLWDWKKKVSYTPTLSFCQSRREH